MSAFSSHETLVVLRVLRTEAEIVGLCGFSSHIVEFRSGCCRVPIDAAARFASLSPSMGGSQRCPMTVRALAAWLAAGFCRNGAQMDTFEGSPLFFWMPFSSCLEGLLGAQHVATLKPTSPKAAQGQLLHSAGEAFRVRSVIQELKE